MKKKNIIVILAILVALCVVIILGFLKNTDDEYLDELNTEEKRVVLEKSYINYAWGFQYRGLAIFNDGTIYKWDYSGKDTYSAVSSLEDESKWILGNGEKQRKKVNKADINKLENYINGLENKISNENTANDAGSNSTMVFNYNLNKKIVVKNSGDYTGVNKTKNAREILKIADKYL